MTEPTPAPAPPPAKRRPMFPITEGDLWRWQQETLTELARFLKAHGPGRPGALPVVPWRVGTQDAVAHITRYDVLIDASGERRDLREVLDAYAAVLGSEVTATDLGHGDTRYRVAGALGERGRVKLTLIATVRADDVEDEDETRDAR